MNRLLKPKVLGDVSREREDGNNWSAFSSLSKRVNLNEERVVRIPFVKIARYAIYAFAAFFLVFGSAVAPTLFTKASGDATTTATSTDPTAERTQLESQLQQLETQIDQYQGQITSYQSQGKTLNGQIAQLNAKIASLNLQIQATNLTIQQLNAQISETQSQIGVTQADLVNKKAAMGQLMETLYQNDQVSLIEVFLKNPRLSDFWDETQSITLLQNDLRTTVQQVTDLQNQLQNQEQDFEASKADAASAVAYQQAQAQAVIPTYTAEVVHTYPHDINAFTEGLFYLNGFLYESTGLEGKSTIRKVRLDTGEVLQKYDIPPEYFGEGIVAWHGRLFSLTWKSQVGFIFDLATFKLKGQFHYEGEGWALTHDERHIIMSDGTSTLRFLDPKTLKETGRIEVTVAGRPLTNVNELEWVKGEIYANVVAEQFHRTHRPGQRPRDRGRESGRASQARRCCQGADRCAERYRV